MLAGAKLLNERQIMATNYANEKLTTAIRNHLLSVDAVPPTAEASKLAGELAEVCLTELNTAGLGSETVENLFAPSAFKVKARGVN
jgi:hypothetical protein